MRAIRPRLPRRPTPAIADWQHFGERRYRPFRVLALAQGLIGALTGPAIVIPLLLALGAHPALATALAVLPVVGTMAQRFIPPLLDRTDGNLRGTVLLFAAAGEPRGLLIAAIVALAAVGWLPAWAAIGLVAVTVGVLGAMGAISYSLLQAWYPIVLPEEERRVVTPRLGAFSLGTGALVLVPIALTIDRLVATIGLWAFVAPPLVAGLAGIGATLMIRRLPRPGRVRVPRRTIWDAEGSERLRRHGEVLTFALLAAGLSPFLSVYAMVVLGTGPGFAIAISATSSSTLVVASLVASSHLRGGSASRLLRASFLLRGFTLFAALGAHPANPLAPGVLLAVAILLALGDVAGQLAANERLLRLATGPGVIAFQSHFVVRNVGAYSGGIMIGSAVMLLGGYAAFAILFVVAGSLRFVAARALDVSLADRTAARSPARIGPAPSGGRRPSADGCAPPATRRRREGLAYLRKQ